MGWFRMLAGFVLLLVLALCLLAVEGGRSGCKVGFPAASVGGSRKLSSTSKEVFEDLRPLDPRRTSSAGNLVGWDLRRVPSGPDPLHHNGSPKKPQKP